jgi:hypothetical protein
MQSAAAAGEREKRPRTVASELQFSAIHHVFQVKRLSELEFLNFRCELKFLVLRRDFGRPRKEVEYDGPVLTLEDFDARGLPVLLPFPPDCGLFFELPGESFGVTGIGNKNFAAYDRTALVAFLKALSDDRVRYERAPFDHPELCVTIAEQQASATSAGARQLRSAVRDERRREVGGAAGGREERLSGPAADVRGVAPGRRAGRIAGAFAAGRLLDFLTGRNLGIQRSVLDLNKT